MTNSLLMLGGTLAMILASEARAGPPLLSDRPGHITEVVVTVDATPAEIYRLITDYAHWPAVLGDVTSVKVEAGGQRDAKVRFRSKALEHEVAVVFDNVADRSIRFHSVDAPPGAHAHGDYELVAIDGGKHTQITGTFYLDVSWPASWVISDSKVRSMRRAKLEHDVTDVVRFFAASKPSASTN